MSTPTFPRPGPTPHPLKTVLWVLFLSSIGGYALQWFHIPLSNYLSLSASHLVHGYVWTLLTYPFVYTYTHLCKPTMIYIIHNTHKQRHIYTYIFTLFVYLFITTTTMPWARSIASFLRAATIRATSTTASTPTISISR